LVFYIFFLACSAYALWHGGGPERAVAIAFLIAFAATTAVNLPMARRFYTVSTGVFLVDLILFAALVAIALKADRYWPLLVASLQAVTVAAHLAKLADPDLIRRAYSMMIAMWSYPQLLLLVLGAARHRERSKRNGIDPSWNGSWTLSTRTGRPAGPAH
jgi:hypothetical protein